jgi:hypothetical protein
VIQEMTSTLLLSTIINLSSARKRQDASKPCIEGRYEQRQDFRKDSNERLFLQIVQSTNPELMGVTLSCTALDVSRDGLGISCHQEIPVGCVIDLWVDDSARPGKFFLSSEVRWSREVQAGNFHVGVKLLEGAATDLDEWRERQA